MIDDFLKEIHELQEYKKRYEYLLKDYNRAMEELCKFKLEKWENTRPQDRQKAYKETWCVHCRKLDDRKGYRCRISSDITKPSIAEENGRKYIKYFACERFEWD